MRDTVTRSKTTYSSRNAGGGESAEEARVSRRDVIYTGFRLSFIKIIVDIREMGALLPSLIDSAGIKVVPSTLTVGDYILSPKMCVERKSLADLEGSFNNGRLSVALLILKLALLTPQRHTQCEAMTSHYETCILLIEFDEDKFGMRVGLSSLPSIRLILITLFRLKRTRVEKLQVERMIPMKHGETLSIFNLNWLFLPFISLVFVLSGLRHPMNQSRYYLISN